jgi:hypothetical protein
MTGLRHDAASRAWPMTMQSFLIFPSMHEECPVPVQFTSCSPSDKLRALHPTSRCAFWSANPTAGLSPLTEACSSLGIRIPLIIFHVTLRLAIDNGQERKYPDRRASLFNYHQRRPLLITNSFHVSVICRGSRRIEYGPSAVDIAVG